MKKLLFIIVLGIFSAADCVAQKAADRLIDHNLDHKKAYALSLPGWLIRSTTKAVQKFEDDKEESKYWDIANYVKHCRFLLIEDYNPVKAEEVSEMITELKEKESFDEFLTARDKGTTLNIFAREKKDKIDCMIFLVNTDDTFVLIRLKCKVPLRVFEEMNYQLINRDNKEVDTDETTSSIH